MSRILTARAIRMTTAGAETAGAVLATATAVPGELQLPLITQDGTLWCWAAVSMSFRQMLRPSLPILRQCDFVMDHLSHLGLTGCCVSVPPPSHCDVETELVPAMRHAGVEVIPQNGSMIFSDMKREIETRKKPVACFIDFPGAPDHFVGVCGIIGATKYVVKDSARGRLELDIINRFTTNYANEGGTWMDTFLVV